MFEKQSYSLAHRSRFHYFWAVTYLKVITNKNVDDADGIHVLVSVSCDSEKFSYMRSIEQINLEWKSCLANIYSVIQMHLFQ